MLTRRDLIRSTLAAGSSILTGAVLPHRPLAGMPAVVTPEKARSAVAGVQSGDLVGDRAVIWSRCDRPARMVVEWATDEQFKDVRRVVGAAALEHSDFTARVDLSGLPPGETVFYRVLFQDLADLRMYSLPVEGRLRTPSSSRRDILFAWGGDTVGQGWGIDGDRGGMRIYESIRRLEPDFFIHSGDTIYADNPLQAEVRLDDGTLWRNLMTPEKAKVAETLDEFRGNYRYNLLDENLRRFNAHVPQLVQWDDHETVNNWFPGRRMDADPRYTVKSCDLLAARAKRAFLDYTPLRPVPGDPERIYRGFRYGPSLEVLMLDERSYRGPNTGNRQPVPDRDTPFLGTAQMRWLKQRLLASTATWKVIASDMPLGLVVRDGPAAFEAWANGDGPPLGRELELAALLRFIRDNEIRNVAWVTADVHYAAAHYYDPAKAQFTEFHPFWEFVAGPLHAGTFGPGQLENTFGPEMKFCSLPPGTKPNRPPSEGLQFFGMVKIDGRTEVMTVSLYNAAGQQLYSVDLEPEREQDR
jgi:alkaline phosphatase D